MSKRLVKLLSKLNKKDIIKLAKMRCKCGHSYLEHINCAFKDKVILETEDGKVIVMEEKIGFLDIESSNLKADFGIVFSYCIKELDGELISNVVKPQEIRKGIYDKRLMKDFCKDVRKFDRVITFYGCVALGHKVLTASLEWKPVEKLKIGDEILGFDEMPKIYTNSTWKGSARRHFKIGKVVHNIPIKLPCYEISLENGEKIIASENHPFLVKEWNTRGGQTWKWKNTFALTTEDYLYRVIPIWEKDTSYEAGYIAGMLDGEGHLSQIERKDGCIILRVYVASQNIKKHPLIVERIEKYLEKLNISYKRSVYDKKNNMINISVVGGFPHLLLFLGKIKPKKLNFQFDPEKLGAMKGWFERIKIKKITYIGWHTVMALGTTCKTYFVDGFGSHNSRFDLPFLRTRAVYYNLDFPIYKEILHQDVYHIIKNRFLIHKNRLETACRFFNIPCKSHPLKPDIWFEAMGGKKKALDYILEHNKEDVISLEALWKKVNFYSQNSKRSI